MQGSQVTKKSYGEAEYMLEVNVDLIFPHVPRVVMEYVLQGGIT